MKRFVEPIEHATALDPVSKRVARVVYKILKPGLVKDLLSGRWIGHPIHPMLTDLPIGFWTTSWVLDIAGGKRAQKTSDAMIALGLAAYVPTVAAGWSDFADSDARRRRVGLVHAGSMIATGSLYALALGARLRGDRKKGFFLAQAAATTATAGAYLGGHLVYGMGTGVRPPNAASRTDGSPR